MSHPPAPAATGPRASAQDTGLGIKLMVATTLVFAGQDAISRHLASEYNVLMVVMIRYWVFALFVVALAARQPGGLRRATASRRPGLQVLRGVLLAAEICIAVLGFVLLGLIGAHAIFAAYPLIVAALSGPVLGERVGWRRWTAIAIGFVGVLILLSPGGGVFGPAALVPLAAAVMFAVYSLLTRKVGEYDAPGVSFFWTGTVGAVAMTAVGIWFWEPMAPRDWGWMALLCGTAILGHWLLIRAYAVAEAGAIQPFSYLHLVWVAGFGVMIFGEVITLHLLAGAAVVVGAGLFTLWRERQRA